VLLACRDSVQILDTMISVKTTEMSVDKVLKQTGCHSAFEIADILVF